MTSRHPWLVVFHGDVVSVEYVEHVRTNVASAPPATREQLDLLKVLLRPRESGTTKVRRWAGRGHAGGRDEAS